MPETRSQKAAESLKTRKDSLIGLRIIIIISFMPRNMYRLWFLVLVAGVSAEKKKMQKSFRNNFKLFIVSSMRQYFNKGFILIDLTSRGNGT